MAGVQELTEMTIGRTEDPESPLKPVTLEATRLFGIGSRTPSGPRQQAEHMIAIDLPVRILFEVLEFKRIRKVMHVFRGEHSQGPKGVPSRKLWHALHAIDKYLRGQAAWLVNYAKRYRAGERVGTSIPEGTANFLVNRRMNKSQQMRWSRMALICCSKSAAQSTMAHSVPRSGIDLIGSPTQT